MQDIHRGEMIPKLEQRETIAQDARLAKEFGKLQQLIDALNEKAIPAGIADTITQQLAPLNDLAIPAPQLATQLRDARHSILKLVKQQLKLVPQKHYLKLWMAIGMSVFGMPFGVIFSMMLDNYAFIGIGLPIGMSIGIGYGTQLDKDAEAEGRQLAIE